ncbi:hypothetical protein P4639_25670 [Priestia megaterium]|uniref:hypothetical protein n=1 Tax=Priestia megaterium TaxID=1404 RepID=UPI002E1E7B90|nr:hypothetical protein [Priestia megaterium]
MVDTLGVISSIISIIGAFIAVVKARKAKKYSEIYHSTDEKEQLHKIFVHLEVIQDTSYRLKTDSERGIKITHELKEYTEIRRKLNTLNNLTPSSYTTISTNLQTCIQHLDVVISENRVLTNPEMTTFKATLNLAVNDVKQAYEDLRQDLMQMQN